jgi:integrase
MASIEQRTRATATSYRVIWREAGVKQQQTFHNAQAAQRFRLLVEGSGNRWPHGWDRQHGFGETPAERGVQTFREWAEHILATRRRANVRTLADYRRDLERHVYPVIGDLGLDEIDEVAVAKLIDALTLTLAPKTVQNIHGMVSSFLKDAVIRGKLPRNPLTGTMPAMPDIRDEDMVSLTPQEFALILSNVPDWYKPLTVLLAGTGLRWSEATALQVRDVSLLGARRVVTVRRAWKRVDGYFVLGEPKTRRSRRKVSISGAVVDALIPLVASSDPGAFVFRTREGRPVRHSNYYNRVWLPAVAAAQRCDEHSDEEKPCGCPGTLTKRPTIHSLRHTHVSWLIAEGRSIVEIQRRVGHESIKTTIDRYGDWFPDQDEATNAAVDRALGRMSEPAERLGQS